MNTSGEVADLMVKEGIRISESATKLAALGAKNLAAIVITLINDNTKLQGKTSIKQLLKSEKPLCILQIKESDLSRFNSEAKKYGVLFTAVSDRAQENGFCDVIAKQDDVTKLNYIMEKMGYAAPKIEAEPEINKGESPEKSQDERLKNRRPRAEKENRQEKGSMKHGDTETEVRNIKPSVRKRIEDIRAGKTESKHSKSIEKAMPVHNNNKIAKRGRSR